MKLLSLMVLEQSIAGLTTKRVSTQRLMLKRVRRLMHIRKALPRVISIQTQVLKTAQMYIQTVFLIIHQLMRQVMSIKDLETVLNGPEKQLLQLPMAPKLL